MTEPKTHTLDVPGAVLHYDVRDPSQASTEPVLLIIGSPMGADGFTTLAGHFTDRTVVTYDPRSAGRSKRTDGASETTPDEHADDHGAKVTQRAAPPSGPTVGVARTAPADRPGPSADPALVHLRDVQGREVRIVRHGVSLIDRSVI